MANGSGKLEQLSNQLNNLQNTVNGDNSHGQFPTYSSGARAYVRVAGIPITVAQSFTWRVVAETKTCDANTAWDIAINQISITANLSELIDPSGSLGSQALFFTIQSAIHQPMVELQVQDAIGSSLFFSRGMFIGMNGSIRIGALSTYSVDFKGIAWQDNIAQAFKPYSNLGVSKSLKSAKNFVSNISGGFL